LEETKIMDTYIKISKEYMIKNSIKVTFHTD